MQIFNDLKLAVQYSSKNADEIVRFTTSVHIYENLTLKAGVLHGDYIRHRSNGNLLSVSKYVNGNVHGEWKTFDLNGALDDHRFYFHGEYLENLNYILNDRRDEAFYNTLALHGIDKEYIL